MPSKRSLRVVAPDEAPVGAREPMSVTAAADRDPLAQAADFPVSFHMVSGVPREEHVEIEGMPLREAV